MRILITGITGFAGSHLAEALADDATNHIAGVSRRCTWPIGHQPKHDNIQLHQADLSNIDQITPILRSVEPDHIYHLAGFASVGQSLHNPQQAWTDNFNATRNLYDAVGAWGGTPRIVFVGSGLIYGEPQSEQHVFTEDSILRPSNPYATSKAAADLLSYQYTCHPQLSIIRARPFNHIGPRQSPEFALASFARQIVAIERGEQTPILNTGNLAPIRDVTDVRDVVQAYITLMHEGVVGEAYNIASEATYSMADMLNVLLQHTTVTVDIRRQEHLLRAQEVLCVRASAEKLRQSFGWQPRVTLAQSLRDVLDYWRSA